MRDKGKRHGTRKQRPSPDPLMEALGALRAPAPTSVFESLLDHWLRVTAPIGPVYVAFTRDGVSFLRTAESVHDDGEEFRAAYRDRFERPLRRASRAPRGLLPALREGAIRSLELDLRGLSQFERDVLAATRRIPAGETRPYAWVAREAGRPRAQRAVGSALGRNPVPLLIPCHRVVRSDGRLGEYIFGASHKEQLLRDEQANLDEVHELAAGGVHYLGSDTTRIVCYPTCHHARRITLVHRHGFRTLADALDVGYRPCQHCKPVVEEVDVVREG